jgi:hypothetical protein
MGNTQGATRTRVRGSMGARHNHGHDHSRARPDRAGGGDVRITGLAVDSREVRARLPLRRAARQPKVHGAEFIPSPPPGRGRDPDRQGGRADRRGRSPPASRHPVVVAEDPRQALAFAAALWFGRSPRRSSPSPARTARPRSRASPARSGSALGHPPQPRHDRGRGRLLGAACPYHARADHAPPRAGRDGRGRGSSTARWKPRPTGSTSAGSTGCG